MHFNLDVFDEAEMPVVTDPQPDGLDCDEAGTLLGSPALIGLSVADFGPDGDPEGTHARWLVDLLADLPGARTRA